ncbi:hypothetical protein ACFWHN_19395, partial [Streptomyces yangpuensis]
PPPPGGPPRGRGRGPTLPDIRMPKLDGLDVTRRPPGSNRPRTVIVTTSDPDEIRPRSAPRRSVRLPPQGRRPGHAG